MYQGNTALKLDRRPPSRLVLGGTSPQLRVLAGIERFTSVFASRRFGKTTLGIMRILQKVRVPHPTGRVWWIAPTYRQCRVPYDRMKFALRRSGLIKHCSDSELVIWLKTGWTIEFRTAERPDNLRSEGVDLVIEDEFAMISDTTHHECIRPLLLDTSGEWLGLGTPKGRRGHGYDIFRRGQDGEPGYAGYRFTAFDGTFIPKSEILEARKHMHKRAFEQELMAAFLDTVGVVFEDVRSRPRLTSVPGEPVGIGIDWAKKVDWTWFVAVGSQSGAVIGWYRAPQRLTYPKQVKLAREFCQRLERRGHPIAKVCHDQTGVGEAVDDILRAERYEPFSDAEGYVFKETTKRTLVEEAIVAFESGDLGFVEDTEADPDGERLIQEHEDYTLTLNKSGKVTYGAPEGFHDDAPTATMLGNRARRGAIVEYAAAPSISFIEF